MERELWSTAIEQLLCRLQRIVQRSSSQHKRGQDVVAVQRDIRRLQEFATSPPLPCGMTRELLLDTQVLAKVCKLYSSQGSSTHDRSGQDHTLVTLLLEALVTCVLAAAEAEGPCSSLAVELGQHLERLGMVQQLVCLMKATAQQLDEAPFLEGDCSCFDRGLISMQHQHSQALLQLVSHAPQLWPQAAWQAQVAPQLYPAALALAYSTLCHISTCLEALPDDGPEPPAATLLVAYNTMTSVLACAQHYTSDATACREVLRFCAVVLPSISLAIMVTAYSSLSNQPKTGLPRCCSSTAGDLEGGDSSAVGSSTLKSQPTQPNSPSSCQHSTTSNAHTCSHSNGSHSNGNRSSSCCNRSSTTMPAQSQAPPLSWALACKASLPACHTQLLRVLGFTSKLVLWLASKTMAEAKNTRQPACVAPLMIAHFNAVAAYRAQLSRAVYAQLGACQSQLMTGNIMTFVDGPAPQLHVGKRSVVRKLQQSMTSFTDYLVDFEALLKRLQYPVIQAICYLLPTVLLHWAAHIPSSYSNDHHASLTTKLVLYSQISLLSLEQVSRSAQRLEREVVAADSMLQMFLSNLMISVTDPALAKQVEALLHRTAATPAQDHTDARTRPHSASCSQTARSHQQPPAATSSRQARAGKGRLAPPGWQELLQRLELLVNIPRMGALLLELADVWCDHLPQFAQEQVTWALSITQAALDHLEQHGCLHASTAGQTGDDAPSSAVGLPACDSSTVPRDGAGQPVPWNYLHTAVIALQHPSRLLLEQWADTDVTAVHSYGSARSSTVSGQHSGADAVGRTEAAAAAVPTGGAHPHAAARASWACVWWAASTQLLSSLERLLRVGCTHTCCLHSGTPSLHSRMWSCAMTMLGPREPVLGPLADVSSRGHQEAKDPHNPPSKSPGLLLARAVASAPGSSKLRRLLSLLCSLIKFTDCQGVGGPPGADAVVDCCVVCAVVLEDVWHHALLGPRTLSAGEREDRGVAHDSSVVAGEPEHNGHKLSSRPSSSVVSTMLPWLALAGCVFRLCSHFGASSPVASCEAAAGNGGPSSPAEVQSTGSSSSSSSSSLPAGNNVCGAAVDQQQTAGHTSRIPELLQALSCIVRMCRVLLLAPDVAWELESMGCSTGGLQQVLSDALMLLMSVTEEGSDPEWGQLDQLGPAVAQALTSVPHSWSCNNPACSNTSGPSELLLVKGSARTCAGCRTARYCSKACLVQHWRQHKRVCKALSAKARTHTGCRRAIGRTAAANTGCAVAEL